MKTKCPVCNSENCRPDFDFPETMLVCENCGSEMNIDGDITLDVRKHFSDEENKQRGFNPSYQCGSCEQMFFSLNNFGECPYCGSGNFVEGCIDE